MSTVVLDAWAIVSWFTDGPAPDRVAAGIRGRGLLAAARFNASGGISYAAAFAAATAERHRAPC